MNFKQKEAQYRQNQIGVDFIPCPDQDYLRVFINGEILKATNFTNSEIFIAYKFTLPPGWKLQIPQEVLAMDLSQSELKQYNCLQSITQTATPILANKQNGGVSNEFYFSFPFDLQLLVKERAAQEQWPTLNFEIFEKDSWERVFNQGCGFFNIPSTPGTHQIQTLAWKPNLQNRKKVFEFFLGGLTRPKSIQSISKSYDITELDNKGPINRMNFNTISSGTIHTRVNIATQSKRVKTEERTNFKVIKFSQETEQVKSEYSKTHVPGQVNTGNLLGGRFTTTKLNQ